MPDPFQSSTELVLSHTLRCIGVASLARVAAAAALPEAEVESGLIDLAVDGLVTRVPGEFGGWGLTEKGRSVDAEWISTELGIAGTQAVVAAAYDDFLPLNPELLDLCTAWQLRSDDGVVTPNDHTDPAYDARVLDRLVAFDRRAAHVYGRLSASMRRFETYGVRLADALRRARSGALDYVADSTESYHAVWFQLHEDLLTTLGIPRH